MNRLQGVWLPIITPFHNDKIDFESYEKLIDFYIPKGISGIIPNGTTGECPTIEESELEELVAKTIEFTNNRVPVFMGLGGNNTNKVIKQIKYFEKHKLDGILSVCPYYNKPDQKGIYEHFKAISESTDLKVVIYNIPHRTGRNIENDTLLKLAELKNIVGVKDSCGNILQTSELIFYKPDGFSVLTGEDSLYYLNLALGGDGGILAAAHLETQKFVEIYKLMSSNDFEKALKVWKQIEGFIPLLFKEPNPAPLKHCLFEKNLISSKEVRLPLVEISDLLKKELKLVT